MADNPLIDEMYEHLHNMYNTNGIDTSNLPKIEDYRIASYQYKILCKYISFFQDNLDDDHEVGLQLASFGQSILLLVDNISYSDPSLIHFYGRLENGNKAHLIQHVNQLNFLLVSQRKSDPSKPARRIGFDTTFANK